METQSRSYIFSEYSPVHNSQVRVAISWQNIFYTVKTKKKTTEVLKGISGFANPGELVTILGSSGAGKTCFLNILAKKTTNSHKQIVTGQVYANEVPVSELNYGDLAGYVTQEDILLPVLTPEEAITFSAKLRCREKDIPQRVKSVIQELNLTEVAKNYIGSVEQKGISGGERKRVCIAVELVSDPSVLFLDEPTSGVDTFTAEMLLDLLIDQTRKGRTVITTVHQPSSAMFGKFQKLVLMSEGHIVYQGDSSQSVEYFRSLGYACPRHINPTDYFMKVLHVVDRNQLTEEESHRQNLFVSTYKHQEPQVLSGKQTENLTELKKFKRKRASSRLVQLKELMQRAGKNAARNPALSRVKLLQTIGIALLVDLVFYDLNTDLEGIQSINGVLFFLVINQATFGSQNATLACKF